MIRSSSIILMAAIMLTAGFAQATQQGVVVLKRWQAEDICTKTAQKAFPEFTAESNAKRDKALQDCIANQQLPPRAPASK
jgi:hypothetical protein